MAKYGSMIRDCHSRGMISIAGRFSGRGEQWVCPISHRRHLGGNAVFLQGLRKVLPYPWVLIIVCNDGTSISEARSDSLPVSTGGIVKEGWILAASQAEGRVPGGFWTRIEMLVEPTIGGTEDTAGFPMKFDDFILSPALVRMNSQVLGPHEEVARGM